jgi:hypothetical protein
MFCRMILLTENNYVIKLNGSLYHNICNAHMIIIIYNHQLIKYILVFLTPG